MSPPDVHMGQLCVSTDLNRHSHPLPSPDGQPQEQWVNGHVERGEWRQHPRYNLNHNACHHRLKTFKTPSHRESHGQNPQITETDDLPSGPDGEMRIQGVEGREGREFNCESVHKRLGEFPPNGKKCDNVTFFSDTNKIPSYTCYTCSRCKLMFLLAMRSVC